jgi:hypothetical protein
MDGLDHLNHHRLAIENSMTYLLWHDVVRRQAGLKGISQVWGEEPSWYFWLAVRPGAFLLRAGDCEEVAGSSLVTYLLHYFPPESIERNEQDLLESPFFDKITGTPVYEHRHEFFDRFIAGEIGLALGINGEPHMTCCSWQQKAYPAARDFFTTFVSALISFHRLSPTTVCNGMPAPLIESRFAVFNQGFFEEFLSQTDNEKLILSPVLLENITESWKIPIDQPLTCTAEGVCGCAHP